MSHDVFEVHSDISSLSSLTLVCICGLDCTTFRFCFVLFGLGSSQADTHRADEDYDTDRKARGERESASLGGALAGGATDRYFSSLNQHHQN